MDANFVETERKYLVRAPWPPAGHVHAIRQIYLDTGGAVSVRLRDTSGVFTLTLKSAVAKPASSALHRHEFEVPVPADTGHALFAHYATSAVILKTRHDVMHAGQRFEVDVFGGDNSGLVLAELELARADTPIILPDWIGPEVTQDRRFGNHALARHPFVRWGLSYAALVSELAPAGTVA